MTNQIQGEILFGGWAGTAASEYAYTPWVPVQGDFATFGVELVELQGLTSLKWNVETRKRDSESSMVPIWSTDKSANSTATPALATSESADNEVLELVRYRFATDNTASTTNFAVFRALQPSWQSNR